MKQTLSILSKYWGFDAFRPMQEDIIDSVIYGKDTLAILPTGGGKSICFQVPGIAREGMCLVISPLISLMQDQVDTLTAKGIRAKAITSFMSYREIDITLDNAKHGALDFLYTSPERIQSRLFIDRFKQMNISLIVIDEAHCISEWGHDFRPPYKTISNLRKYHPEVPFIALTATATEAVKIDICTQLQLKNPSIFEGNLQRKNVSYEVYHIENKEDAILKWLNRFPTMCGIIYCQTRKSVKELASSLIQQGISVGVYHGGMDSYQRKSMMQDWMSNKIHTMIATNAFGMGIDKQDVRFVIHYEFPSNLEAYYQEAGRAGRDGKEARTLALITENDIKQHQDLISIQFPRISIVKFTYRALCNYLGLAIGSGKGETFPINLSILCANFKLGIIPTFQSLKILEMNGDILFNESNYNPTRIKFAIGNTQLYSFQIKYERVSDLIQFIARSYPGVFNDFFVLNEAICVSKLGISVKELDSQLTFLEKNGVIDITWKTSLPQITFLHERLPDDYMRLSEEVYQTRKDRAELRLKYVDAFLSMNLCREQYLCNYFGQQTEQCGKCDYCKEKIKSTLNRDSLSLLILTYLETPKSLEDMKHHFSSVKLEELKYMIGKLEKEEKIKLIKTRFKKI
jgi:ATP-dependent DNA helicase RecQ